MDRQVDGKVFLVRLAGSVGWLRRAGLQSKLAIITSATNTIITITAI